MYINYENRVFGLDVIRAIAILLVLFSHSTLLLFPNEAYSVLKIIQFFGAIGVDLFFVLSGFLIGGILISQIDENKTQPKDFFYFLIRRWFKTFPNYFLILILNIIVIYIFNNASITGITPFFFFLQNFSYAMPDFFTESWSLSIEEFAYVIIPVLFLLSIHVFQSVSKYKIFIVVTLTVIVTVFLARLFFYLENDITSYKHWSSQVRKVVVYRIDSIYYGFLAAYIFHKSRLIWNQYKKTAFILGVILFFTVHGFIFILDAQPQNSPMFYALFYLPIVSLSLLLLFPVFSNWQYGTILKKEITTVSLLAYALYLVNYSLVLLPIQKKLNIETFSAIEKLATLFFYWILSFLLAYIVYTSFEKPIMSLRDSRFIRKHLNN